MQSSSPAPFEQTIASLKSAIAATGGAADIGRGDFDVGLDEGDVLEILAAAFPFAGVYYLNGQVCVKSSPPALSDMEAGDSMIVLTKDRIEGAEPSDSGPGWVEYSRAADQ